jgi:hypothetical protein
MGIKHQPHWSKHYCSIVDQLCKLDSNYESVVANDVFQKWLAQEPEFHADAESLDLEDYIEVIDRFLASHEYVAQH